MYLCESVEVVIDQSQQLQKLKRENRRLNDENKRNQQVIQRLHVKRIELQNTIRHLTSSNKILQAHNKQLQSQLNRTDYDATTTNADEQTNPNNIASVQKNENVYEVEKVMSHKIRNNVRYFLIRWKGYDSDSDTWEREENLNCPRLVKQYFHQ